MRVPHLLHPITAPVDMTVASFFMMRATIDGKEVARPYTPIKVDGNRVFFLVKVWCDVI